MRHPNFFIRTNKHTLFFTYQ
ncbi:hypothetical protein D046_8350, partial [Vibrio parahaemolyticus V-223/04]